MRPAVSSTTSTRALALGSLAIVAVCTAVPAQAQTPYVRLSASYVTPADKSDPAAFPPPFPPAPADAFKLDDKTAIEIAGGLFVTENFAVELAYQIGQRHTATLTQPPLGQVGSFVVSAALLTAQYHVMPKATFSPFVGAGVAYTRFAEQTITQPGVNVEGNDTSWTVLGGVNFRLADAWMLTGQVRYQRASIDLRQFGQRLTTLHFDPLTWSLGVGYRF